MGGIKADDKNLVNTHGGIVTAEERAMVKVKLCKQCTNDIHCVRGPLGARVPRR